jgi:GDPmannose 4,6-dehydratase
MKSALITGILGQDGTYLARRLVDKGYRVHGLIRSPVEREPRIHQRFTPAERAQIVFHTGTLEDPFSLAQILKVSQPAEVYHLAGVSDSRQSFLVPEQTMQSIAVGTLRLLEAGRLQNESIRYFLASSCEIFGRPMETPQHENTLRSPLTPYGVAKQAADQMAKLYREKYNQFISVGILYNHESPLRPANYLSRRVAQAVAAVKRGTLKKLTLGDLSAERDWSDSRDFVEGFWLTLQAPEPGEFIFASGQRRTVRELVDCAFRAADLDYQQFVEAGAHPASTEVKSGLCGQPGKAEKILDWKRTWTFDAMIKDMVAAEMEERTEIDRANPLVRLPR